MNPVVFRERMHWTAIVACSCSIWCAALVDESTALQIVPDTAELRIIALPAPSAVDQVSALPTSQTTYITGDTFFLELWAQTTAPEGLVQASADLSFSSASMTAVAITHTAIFDIFPSGTINNLAGTIDNLSGSHTPVDPPCSDQLGATPQWARVAVVEMRARTAALTPIGLLDSGDLFFVVAVCNSLQAVSSTFVGVTLDIQAPLATVSLVARPVASASDLATALPASQTGFPVGDPFVLELWAQTDSANGLAQVSTDVTFDSTLVTAGTITHSTLFNLFASGSINNFTGTIDNLSGAHPPVIPSCSDSTGTAPNWARVATVSMTADAVGSHIIQSADALDLIFVMAVCGSEISPATTFGGVPVAVTLCGNGVTEPGEDCDDGGVVAGDCCSPTCTFEPVTTVCRGAVDACDVDEVCDGAGACPVDGFQAAGTACGNPLNTVCDGADACDGGGGCVANISPITTECRAIASDCDVAEFCDGVGGCPLDDFQLAGTACGDPTASVCDNPDICDGNGTCSPEFATVAVLCRLAVDVCDVDDFCDGAGACSVDAFQVAGTTCGDPANTTCDNPDTCDGLGICGANFEAVTTVCRVPVSDCDVPEFCDGAGRCPNDAFLAAGTSCGSPTTTVCDNPDTCDAAGTCLPNPGSPTILCRAAASACDVDDFCDGLGSCSVDAFELAGTTCGDPTVTDCDGADTCDGTGTCLSNFEPTATVCRPSAPECDATEFCDGAGACPVDAFALAGTACGNPAGTVCDNPDSCDGVGVCVVNLEPATTVCRLAVDECDVTELCDGLGQCPLDTFAIAGLACGDPSNTICDSPDSCDGAGACQPNFETPATSCRTVLGECDAEDFCDGAGSCSADAFQLLGTPCGDATATVCDAPDTCDGGGTCQQNLEPVTTTCRATGGFCDLTEFCDGTGFCPPDAKSLIECRAAAGECDVADFCDGVGNNCPADAFAATGAACGDPADAICDRADTCDGGGTCQANIEPSTFSCRLPTGDCDIEEFCDGVGQCPGDQLVVAGTSCGSATVTNCDNADTCDGGGICLTNPQPTTTACRAAAGVCDVADFCDGAGSCSADAKSTAECNAAVDACDVAEVCNGVDNACPVDAFAATGTACGDVTTTTCDNPDSCDGGGVCLTNPQPTTTECRASAGACDLADFCDGAGSCSADAKSTAECKAAVDACDVAEVCNGIDNTCPVDAFAATGTACGNVTTTTCDNPDSCDGGGICLTNPQPVTTECRIEAGVCDVADFCDGAGSCSADAKSTAVCNAAVNDCDVAEVCNGVDNTCPVDVFAAAGASCGNVTVTTCDNADTCDGTGVCLTNPQPTTTLCRNPAGVCDEADFCDGAGSCSADAKSTAVCDAAINDCDVAEVCNGVDNTCPTDVFVAAGTACGSTAVTVCDNADTCDGGGVCLTNPDPTTTLCRIAVGVCDLDDFCDGAGSCSADAKSTAECSPAVDACDAAEFCDGIGDNCPIDGFAAAGTACGDVTTSVCDNADTCDGGGICLANPEPVATECRTAAGACDVADFCDGAGLCSADAKSIAECRAAAGDCDVPESCDGIANDCPVDVFVAAGVACGDVTTSVCDNADTCDGGGSCLTNPEPVTTLCLAAAGVCDADDFCDGAGSCSADAKSTAECRAAFDGCDAAESCDGVGNDCPVDGFSATGTACGSATVTNCDNADSCDGSGICLTNPEPMATECRAAAGACDVADFCDGAGLCSADAKEVTECRAAFDACDVAESCDGVTNDCPVDDFAATGTACGNATVTSCDGADSCDSLGTCNSNNAVDGASCVDASFCNGDETCFAGVCAPGPAVCTDVCETCNETPGVCSWCIFDHNLNSIMDGFDFSFFSGCFGLCVLPGDACFPANYDASPDGCVGGGDFGAFSGCFGLACGSCSGCSGPAASGGSARSASATFAASVQLVAVDLPQAEDVSEVLPVARDSFSKGEWFSLEVWATLTQNSYDGLGSAYVDLTYDPSRLQVDDIVSSDSFSLFSRGSTDSSLGLISALGGCAPVGEGTLGSKSNWVRVATLRMRALDAGSTTVTAEPSYGPYGVSVFGRFGDLPSQQIEFGVADLQVRSRGMELPKRTKRKRSSR